MSQSSLILLTVRRAYSLVKAQSVSGRLVLPGLAVAGAVILLATASAVAGQGTPPGSSVRSGPSSFQPGKGVTITNQLAPLAQVGLYTLTEFVPNGWAVGGISDGGSYDPANRWVRWLFVDNLVRAVTYQLIAPTNISTAATLSGEAAFDGTSVPITGLTLLPLELPPSGALTRQLPATYRVGKTVNVTLHIAPDAGVGLYGVEEMIPTGWLVLNPGGGSLAAAGTIKWGPFVDVAPLDLTYTLAVPSGAVSNVVFRGTGWFDSATVTTSGDSVMAAAPMGGGNVSRTLPAQYASGQTLTVSLAVQPDLGTEVYAVLETPPLGWVATNFSDFGALSGDGRTIRWGPFMDADFRTLTYDLVAPPTARTNVVFSGAGQFDGVTATSVGQVRLSWVAQESGAVTRAMPVTCRPGQSVWITNLVAPSAAVTTYAVEDVVPPGWTVLDTGGGTYVGGSHSVRWGPVFDNATNSLVWQLMAPTNASGTVTFSGVGRFGAEVVTVGGNSNLVIAPSSQGVAFRSLPGFFEPGVAFSVTNTIQPAAGVAFCVVEEGLPMGWGVTNISHGGFVLTELNRLRWGPFADDQARTLTYTLVPPLSVRGNVSFSGLAFFDETQTTILGSAMVAANSPPTCSDVPDQTARSDRPMTITFSAADDETVAEKLQVGVTSSNSALLPDQNLVLGWIGSTRSLTISPQPEQEGYTTLTLTVSDGVFTTRRSFLLQVRMPPRLTLAPTNQLVQLGTTAQFFGAATGSEPLSFQWQRDGSTVPGATSTNLTLSNVQTNQAGFYRFVAANNLGAVTSVVARLTVNSPPVPGLFLLSTYRNAAKTFSASKLTRAAFDPDGDALVLTSVNTVSTNGGVVKLSGGQITYTPPVAYTGADAFAYWVSDGRGGNSAGTVNVTVESSTAVSLNQVFGPIVTNGNFVVRFAGLPGYTYTIEYSDSLAPINWQKATNLTAPSSAGSYGRGVFQFSQSAAGVLIRFYRTVYPSY